MAPAPANSFTLSSFQEIRHYAVHRFAAKALRLRMNEIGSVTCFENYSSK